MVSLLFPVTDINKGKERLGASKVAAERIKFRNRLDNPASDEPFGETLNIKDNLNY